MIQNINNTGAIINKQFFLGDIDTFNIDDLFNNTNKKEVNTQIYPTWLVPLDIALQLKEIAFNKDCAFYYDERLLRISPYHDEEFSTTNWNDKRYFRDCVSLPTWEQVFAWFREKGFMITLINYEDESKFSFYNMKIRGGVHYAGAFKTYEGARESLVYKLIEIYESEQKQGNNI